LSRWVTWVLFRNLLPMLISSSVYPFSFCISCKVSGLILRSLIHFELILVQGERHGSSFQFSVGRYSVFPATFVEEAILSPCFWCLCQNSGGFAAQILIWVFCSVGLHVCFCASIMLVLFPWLCIMFEVRNCDTSSVSLFAQYCLGYLQSLCFQIKLGVDFLISVIDVIGILIGIQQMLARM
jgi:hypothetical protein